MLAVGSTEETRLRDSEKAVLPPHAELVAPYGELEPQELPVGEMASPEQRCTGVPHEHHLADCPLLGAALHRRLSSSQQWQLPAALRPRNAVEMW